MCDVCVWRFLQFVIYEWCDSYFTCNDRVFPDFSFKRKIHMLTDYTDLAMSQVTQRQSVAYNGSIPHLMSYLYQLSGNIRESKDTDRKGIQIFDTVNVYFETGMLVLEVITLVYVLNKKWWRKIFEKLLCNRCYHLNMWYIETITQVLRIETIT